MNTIKTIIYNNHETHHNAAGEYWDIIDNSGVSYRISTKYIQDVKSIKLERGKDYKVEVWDNGKLLYIVKWLSEAPKIVKYIQPETDKEREYMRQSYTQYDELYKKHGQERCILRRNHGTNITNTVLWLSLEQQGRYKEIERINHYGKTISVFADSIA